jgi:hypothetical protein
MTDDLGTTTEDAKYQAYTDAKRGKTRLFGNSELDITVLRTGMIDDLYVLREVAAWRR